jgi:hypothetical protein
MWLLGIYGILVIVSEALSVGLLYLFNLILPSAADAVFMAALLAGFVLPWPVAVRITDGWEK